MRHIFWTEAETYSVGLLVKSSAFNKQALEQNYTIPLHFKGVLTKDVIAFTLDYFNSKSPSAKLMKEYLAQLMPVLDEMKVKHLYVADSNYFKVLTGQAKADPHYGYAMPCKLKGYEHMKVVLGLNYGALIYNPELQAKLDLSLATLASSVNGTYQPPGVGIIHTAQYPESLQGIQEALKSLHQYPVLTADIEAFSLRFNEAGIGTIAFAWDQHNGLAFACDYKDNTLLKAIVPKDVEVTYGIQKANPAVRALLREFFETYQGEITWHFSAYDLKVIIYTLWMQDGLDTMGLLKGLEVMTRHFGDTKIIAYLATNSTAGNVLGLKALAHEFAGNWAVEVKDIRKVPLDKLLEYNLIDALCTAYTRDKYYPIMVADQQGQIYKEIMLPSQKLLLQMELTGMPLIPERVKEVKAKLQEIDQAQLNVINNSPLVQTLNQRLRQDAWQKDFDDRKGKAKKPEKIKPKELSAFDALKFNPNSGPQLQKLLYDQLGLPVLDLTDTKLPATGAETVEKLIHHTSDPAVKALLEALIIHGGVGKMLTTFIPAFETSIDKGDGIWWLHGSFNIGGALSGRLSSSDPNLQNIPANVKIKIGNVEIELGKLIKYCFAGPPGWLFCGADFNSLEDMISALTTKDPNKLKVYTDGFDGHCLRAVMYFRDENPDLAKIDINDPKQVNSFKKDTHPLQPYRQASKTPTFALTYAGTYHTLMANLGWPEVKAKKVEAGYHELYKVSDQYVQDKLAQASKDGYVTVAFGLRVRTPLMAQVVWGSPKMPYEAAAEGRSAGNALGQSYGLLNNRAAVDFFRKVWASKYRLDIKPVGLIHDAIYILVRDKVDVVAWANVELIKSMQWQELPEIQHPTVKLGAALDIFWPSWAKPTTLPNDADWDTIINICNATKREILTVA